MQTVPEFEATPETTVRDLVLQRPAALRVLDTFHIDYCCGGGRPLAEACTRAGVEIDALLAALAEEEARAERAEEERDWSDASCAELIDFVLETHHEYTRHELARLAPLMSRVAARHGPAHPELVRLAELFAQLAGDMGPHLMREERVLFPYIRSLEATNGATRAPFGDIAHPLAVMDADHQAVGEQLAEMRALTRGYTLPAGACGSYRALFEGLHALERDLHRHVHLENNLLFPKARALAEAKTA